MKDIYLVSLYDCYNSLLTDKQKKYFEDYYFNNLSLSEISENYNISRNAIHKQIKEVSLKLENLEKNLKIFEKNKQLEELIKVAPKEIQKKLEEILRS